MTISDAQFSAWLKSSAEIRCVLVEADVKLAAGGTTTRYLSNKAFSTGATDTPANTSYSPRIGGGIKFTRSISLDGNASMSFGDIELINQDGALDSWLLDFWAGRGVRVYLGDVAWPRADFRLMFSGVLTGVDCRARNRINLKIGDTLQRLNSPVTDTKLGGSGSLADSLVPLCFGECHNITPKLVDPATNEYQVHASAIESIIEVRDNGVPVSFTPYLPTGRFRLAAAPTGAVTASVQGAKITAPSSRLTTNTTFTGSPWTWGNIASMPQSSAGGVPFVGAVSYAMVANSTVGAHQVYTGSTTVAGFSTTAQVYVKKNISASAILSIIGVETTASLSVKLDFDTGAVTLSNNAAYTTGDGSTLAGHAEYVENGWWVMTLSGIPDTTSTTRRFLLQCNDAAGNWSFAGDGVSTMLWASSPVSSYGTWPLTCGENAESTYLSVYRNRIGDLIRHIATTYGSSLTRLADLDFDRDSMVQFQAANMQPVGIYLPDRANVLDVCNKLAASVGGRLTVSSDGRIGMVKLTLPQAAPGTSVGPSDVLAQSVQLREVVPVVAAVKAGFCKNFTVQQNLTSGILPEHSALFATEWLTRTVADATTASDYNLFVEPTLSETCLLVGSDASTEAQRRLDMFKTQRVVVKYTGQYHLLTEVVGGAQTLTNSRFGLSSGKTGQIISIGVDLLSPHVDIEVLI